MERGGGARRRVVEAEGVADLVGERGAEVAALPARLELDEEGERQRDAARDHDRVPARESGGNVGAQTTNCASEELRAKQELRRVAAAHSVAFQLVIVSSTPKHPSVRLIFCWWSCGQRHSKQRSPQNSSSTYLQA